jgi:ParB/RepB/Spo0J family partition protein
MMIAIDKIDKNSWNPNVMAETEYLALKQDMTLNGPDHIDAILVSPADVFFDDETLKGRYVVVDGEHRWKIAKELKWPIIKCDVQSLTEEDAKAACYRRNRERGTLDPFKEAELFKSELPTLKQKDIADKYLVSTGFVSQRLSLLRLVPEIVEQVQKLPRGNITPSHLEPIATLPEGEQKKIGLQDDWGNGNFRSVAQITEEVNRVKRQLAEKEALRKALETAEFPKCPKCGKEPSSIDYRKLPWVDCSSYNYNHVWNLDTGKDPYYEERVEQHKINGEKAETVRTSVIRSAHTIAELSEAFAERIREMVPKLKSISAFDISGSLEDGREFRADFNGYEKTMSVSVHTGDKYFSFSAEDKVYRSGEKSKINCWSPDYLERTKLFIDDAFQGKLEIPPEKRLSNPMPSAEEIAKSIHEEQANVDLEIPCLDCANDSDNGGNCHREHFVANEEGGYTCKSKRQLSGEELAKISLTSAEAT